jgi:hypothetical protein
MRSPWTIVGAFAVLAILAAVPLVGLLLTGPKVVVPDPAEEPGATQAAIYVLFVLAVLVVTLGGAIWFAGRNRIASVACLGAALLGLLGGILSQYAPVMGGLLETHLARPFSPARIALAPAHVVLGAVLGAILFGGFAAAARKPSG